MLMTRRYRMASLVGLCLFVFSYGALAQKGDTGRLKTKINPGRTGVFVGGKFLGPAANFRIARTYSLPAGEHEVMLTEPRYKDFTTKVTIQAGKTTVLEKIMEPLPAPKPPFGRLRVVQSSANKFGAVYLNEKYMGHIDEFSNGSQGLLINPGEYKLKVAAVGGGQDYESVITIKENQTTTVKAGAN